MRYDRSPILRERVACGGTNSSEFFAFDTSQILKPGAKGLYRIAFINGGHMFADTLRKAMGGATPEDAERMYARLLSL